MVMGMVMVMVMMMKDRTRMDYERWRKSLEAVQEALTSELMRMLRPNSLSRKQDVF